MPMESIRIELRAVIYPDDGCWIAHCLELDVAAEGSSPIEAAESLVSLCDYQIDNAIQHGDLNTIFRPAPPEIWSLYAKAKDTKAMLKPGHGPTNRINRFEARELCPT